MATSGFTIADLTNCAICLEAFTRPKMLPCQHTYCYACLLSLGSNEAAKIITCPECREVHDVPEGGIANFKDNIMAKNLLGMRGNAREEVACADCKLNPSVSACEHCKTDICASCLVEHIKLSTELKMSLRSVQGSILKSETEERELHLRKAKHECAGQLKDLKTLRERKLHEFATLLAEFVRSSSSIEHFMELIVRAYGDVLQSSDKDVSSHSYFASLWRRIGQCTTRATMKNLRENVCDFKSIVRLIQTKKDNFRFVPGSESGGVGTSFGRIENGSVAFDVRSNFKDSDEVSYKKVVKRLSEIGPGKAPVKYTEKSQTESCAVRPKIERQLVEDLLDSEASTRAQSIVKESIDHVSGVVEKSRGFAKEGVVAVQKSLVNFEEKATDVQKFPWKEDILRPPQIATPPPIPNLQNQLPCNVDYRRKGRGWIPILGQSSDLDESKCLQQPLGLAYRVLKDDVYVADPNNNRIMAYKSDGSNARVFFHVTDAQDVAISDDGSFLYIAAGKRGLIKVDLHSGKRVKIIRECSLGRFDSCVAVACHRDCTFVVDQDFECVFVYGSTDQEIRHFGGKYLYGQNFIAISVDGTMYITHNSNRQIDVFKWNGQYLYQFLSADDDDSYGGVALDGDGYVYVANWAEDCVDVYDDEANWVKTIGGHGKRPGRMIEPWTMCFMPDGRLVVSDCANGRLQIF